MSAQNSKQEPYCLTTDQARDVEAAYNRFSRSQENVLSGLGMLLYELNKPDRSYKSLMQCEALVQQRETAARERSRAFQEQVLALVVKDFCARVDALTITAEQQVSLSAFSRRLGYPGLTWKGWCRTESFTYEILAELEQIFFPEEP